MQPHDPLEDSEFSLHWEEATSEVVLQTLLEEQYPGLVQLASAVFLD